MHQTSGPVCPCRRETRLLPTSSDAMATHREAKNPTFSYVEPMPWPKDVPKVDEVGTTSAPLKSIAFFFGQFCKDYTEDFMLCKNEDRNPEHCLKEGRRVTRCAQDLIQKIGEKCGSEWDAHWQCLESNNQVCMRGWYQANDTGIYAVPKARTSSQQMCS